MSFRCTDGSPYRDAEQTLTVRDTGMPIELIHATLGVAFFAVWAMIVQFAFTGKNPNES